MTTLVKQEQKVSRADILNRAADLLEEFGWCQRAFAKFPNAEGRLSNWTWADYLVRREMSRPVPNPVAFCMVGAFTQACVDLTGLESYIGCSEDEIAWIEWNDSPGRTKGEVVTKLRELAREATCVS